jgi:hypothetical protein
MHAINKHKKKNYDYENIFEKRRRKMIWSFFIPFSFLEMVHGGTTQGYFHRPIDARPFARFFTFVE